MCYTLIIKLFKMVWGSIKKSFSNLVRGRNRRDSEEVTSLQGVSSNSKQSKKQSKQMGKGKNKKQQSAPSTSPYQRRTGHMNQSPYKSAVTNYPPFENLQTSQHCNSLSSNSGTVCAQVEAKIGDLEDQCAAQNAKCGSPDLFMEDGGDHPSLFLEESETGSCKHYSCSTSNQALNPPMASTSRIHVSNQLQKPPAFNGSKSSGQTEDPNHSQEPPQVEQTILDRHDYFFSGITERRPATRSQSYSPFDISDQGPVTRSQTKFRRSTPSFIGPQPSPSKKPYFGTSELQDNFGNLNYNFGETSNTKQNDEFDPKKYIPEGLYVPPVMLKRMVSMKSAMFCQEEVKKLVSNNEQLDRALKLADQSYDENNVAEMLERKQKIQDIYEFVHEIPFFECETLKFKISDTEGALRNRLEQLEKQLPPKEEASLMDMDIEEIDQVLSSNYELPPNLDIPTSLADRIRKRNDPKYAEQQINMLKKVYADIDTIKELLVEATNFCGSLAELQNLKSKLLDMDIKVYKLSVWNHQPLIERIERAKLELNDALETLGCIETVFKDVKSALSFVDSAIHNKKARDLKSLKTKMATLEKKLVNYLTVPDLPVNLKLEVSEAVEKLRVRQQQVHAIVAAFETFTQVIQAVNEVEKNVKKLQTVKVANAVGNQINELLTFCQEFESLDNKALSEMKDFTYNRLKSMEENICKANEFFKIREELDKETLAVNDLANQISGFWGTMAELQTLKQQIHEKQKALSKFSSVENSQLKSMLEQALKMLSDSKNLLEDREVLIEGQSCQDDPEEDSNLEADKPPDLSKILSESRSMEKIGKFTLQLLSVQRQLSDKTMSFEQGKWLLKQLVECDTLLEHMKVNGEVERKHQTQALNFCHKLHAQVKEMMKLKQDTPVIIISIALTALGFYSEIEENQLNRGRARWLEDQLLDCQTRLDAIELPEGVAREARRDVLNLCNEALKSLKALAAQNNW